MLVPKKNDILRIVCVSAMARKFHETSKIYIYDELVIIGPEELRSYL
jgi:hypothetical protein